MSLVMHPTARAAFARAVLLLIVVFSGVNSWPRMQCVLAAFVALIPLPRDKFTLCVTASR